MTSRGPFQPKTFYDFYDSMNWLNGCTARITVNGLMSKWRPVTSGFLMDQYWDQHCVTSVSNMDSGTECTLSNFADDTKLCGVVNMLEERIPSRGTLIGLRDGPM